MSKSQFGTAFEKAVLACMTQDPRFLKEAVTVLRPEQAFVDQMHVSAGTVILKTYIETKAPPSRIGFLSALVNQEYQRKQDKKKADQEVTLRACEELANYLFQPCGQLEDVKKQFLEFCRRREMETTVLDAYNKLESGELDPCGVADIIRRTQQRINSTDQGGSDFFATIDELPQDLARRKTRQCTTGFSSLDRIMGGGPASESMLLYMAGAKAGKSMLLVHAGFHNVIRGKTVVHYTLEISEVMTRLRYAARITGIPMVEIERRQTEMLTGMVKFWEAHKPRLFIKGYPSQTATCDDLRNYLYYLESQKGVRPDVIIVDYADEMATRKSYKEHREGLREIYGGLRAMSKEFDAPMVTASQINREGMGRDTARMTHAAEDINKIRIADSIVTFSATDDEKREKHGRLLFDGSREAATGSVIEVVYDWERCFVGEKAKVS